MEKKNYKRKPKRRFIVVSEENNNMDVKREQSLKLNGDLKVRKDIKIGRASCRERVCQYV